MNQWSETKATSRYGIFIDSSAKGFIGLDGVNNVGVANNQLVDMKWSPITDNQKAQVEKKNEDFYLKWSPGTLSDAVNRMLSPNYNSTWGQFASTKWTHEGHGNSMSGFLSLEYIHNNVHVGALLLNFHDCFTHVFRTLLADLTLRPVLDT